MCESNNESRSEIQRGKEITHQVKVIITGTETEINAALKEVGDQSESKADPVIREAGVLSES